VTKGTKVAGLIIAASLLAAGCGSSDDKADQATPSTTAPSGEMPGGSVVPGGVSNPVAAFTDCAEDAEGTTATVDAAPLGGFEDQSTYEGTLDLSVVETIVTTEPIGEAPDRSPDVPQGKYVVVGLDVTNNANQGVSPTEIISNLHLTDGEASWESADHQGAHGLLSAHFADTRGDVMGEIGPGFDGRVWVVFDVPESVEPNALAHGLDRIDGLQLWACFTLPAPTP
jgi:hypothetical protein